MIKRQKSGFRAKIGALQYNNFNAGTNEGSSTTASIHNKGIGCVFSKDLISPTIGIDGRVYDSSLSVEAGLFAGKGVFNNFKKEGVSSKRSSKISSKQSLLYKIFLGKDESLEFESGVHRQGILVNEFFNRFGYRSNQNEYIEAKFCIPGYAQAYNASQSSNFEYCAVRGRFNLGSSWIFKIANHTCSNGIQEYVKSKLLTYNGSSASLHLEMLLGKRIDLGCLPNPIEFLMGPTIDTSYTVVDCNAKSAKDRVDSRCSVGLKAEASTKIDTKIFPLLEQIKFGMTYRENDLKKVKECGDNKKLDLSATVSFGADSMLPGIFPNVGFTISPSMESEKMCSPKFKYGLSTEF